MNVKIINFITGLLLGILLTTGVILSSNSKTQNETPKQDISMNVPKELPKDEIEFDVIDIPQNLKEVNIL